MYEDAAPIDESLEVSSVDSGAEAEEGDLGDGAETVHLFGDEGPRR